MLQNASPLRKSPPGPPNSSDADVSCTAPATENASLQILFKCPTPVIVFGMLQNPHILLTFEKVYNPLRLPRESTSEPPKVARTCRALYILTSKCASRHNSVHFFDISRSEPGVFCTFWFQNVLRATTACTFSTSQLPKVVRTWCVLYILTSKCASRHNSVHLFDISTSKSGPELVCVVHFDFEMCFAPQVCNFSSLIWPAGSAPATLASLLFDPPEPQIIGKTQCFATFLPFRAPASSFFWLFLFSDLLSSTLLFSLTLPVSAFHLSILSEVWLLNFLRLSRIAMNKRNMIPCVQCETWGYDVGHSSDTETKAMQPWFIWRANITKYLQIKLYIYIHCNMIVITTMYLIYIYI